MVRQEAAEEYSRALKLGQREYKDALAKGKYPYPKVLDDILKNTHIDYSVNLGTMEIPMDLIVGTKTAGRQNAFSRGFYPLLDSESEFGHKWIDLCESHLESGIRDPIQAYEYLGRFYVEEGNKRVSVLHSLDAAQVPGVVTRLVPVRSDVPAVKNYFEFLDFYKLSGIYGVYFSSSGGYTKLLTALGTDSTHVWTTQERQAFKAGFTYFKEALSELRGHQSLVEDGDALLAWLQAYSFEDLRTKSKQELMLALRSIWQDVEITAVADPISVSTQPEKPEKERILARILPDTRPTSLRVAFVYERTPETSAWCKAHDLGRLHLEDVFASNVTTVAYHNAKPGPDAEEKIAKAVEEGADLVFATTPPLVEACLRVSARYPSARILNCSVEMPYTRIRTYYSRIYEGKFITGTIAGAMTQEDRIGYVGSYPIYGVPASINAFALGVRMTNPRAKVVLKWSCLPGDPMEEFRKAGIHVVSNRDVPTPERLACEYGTYMERDGKMEALGSPCWNWGRFYENVVQSVLDGSWNNKREDGGLKALNYWWGMSSGVVDVLLSESLPAGVLQLAQILRKGVIQGSIDPFRANITTQDGRVINDGGRVLSMDEIIHMDWLCDTVEGRIPGFEELLDMAKPVVRLQGVYRESIPAERVPE